MAYKNIDNETPDYHASYYLNWILQEKLFTPTEKLHELELLEPNDISIYYPTLLNPLHIESLVYGSINKDEARLITNLIEAGLAGPEPLNRFSESIKMIHPNITYPDTNIVNHISSTPSLSNSNEPCLNLRPLPPLSRFHISRTHVLPHGTQLIYRRSLPNPEMVNNALEFYIQVGPSHWNASLSSLLKLPPISATELNTNQKTRACLLLFSDMASEPCFDRLRTKEQLGYAVGCGPRFYVGMMGFRIMVQSEKNPVVLEERVEAFLEYMNEFLSNLSDEELS